jgi:hypothetical protein
LSTRKRLSTLTLVSLLLFSTAACGSLNNPFNPAAELQVVDVVSSSNNRLIGIEQSVTTQNNTSNIVYTYFEPVVTIRNKPLLPNVTFNRYKVKISLSDGTTLPEREYPISKASVPAGAVAGGGAQQVGTTVQVQFSLLSATGDIRSTVYPGDRAPRSRDGLAEVVLYGVDSNGNPHELPFSFPLSFSSLIFTDSQSIPVAAPSDAPEPESSASP